MKKKATKIGHAIMMVFVALLIGDSISRTVVYLIEKVKPKKSKLVKYDDYREVK
jgi:hypothetical protein